MIKTKSVHDPIGNEDGIRILVSIYRPTQLPDFRADLWFPELGSPLELIKNWQGKPFNWEYFAAHYREQLASPALTPLLTDLADRARNGMVTLIGHAKQSHMCHRTLLKEYLDQKFIYAPETK